MPFEFEKTALPEVLLVKPEIFRDGRGFFTESYKKSDFLKAGIKEEFVQDNHSKSSKNVLRGLHYQKAPFAQAKLVRCVEGRVMDVAVDIRKGSPTFAKWVSVELTPENGHMLFLPEGFAHGFLVLSETAEISYKCSREFAPQYDAGVRFDDPKIAVNWGIKDPVLSEKDRKLPYLEDYRDKG